MRRLIAAVTLALLLMAAATAHSDNDNDNGEQARIEALDEPLYTPFVERYVLDELKQLRTDMAAYRVDVIQQVVDRELTASDKAVSYATDTVTYFFYLIAGVSSLLVIVGWTSIRDVKAKVHSYADEEIGQLVERYETRLRVIEQQLQQKSRYIEENREEIERTQDVHALWLRASQESNQQAKIKLYDSILTLKPDDCDAYSHKADAVLELGEPQWAANLCEQALAIDSSHGHALYQLACAQSVLGHFDEAKMALESALEIHPAYAEDLHKDNNLDPLRAAGLLEQPLSETG